MTPTIAALVKIAPKLSIHGNDIEALEQGPVAPTGSVSTTPAARGSRRRVADPLSEASSVALAVLRPADASPRLVTIPPPSRIASPNHSP